MTLKLSRHVMWILHLLLFLGCSRPETVEVSGAVTWEGATMPQGDIVFASIDHHIPAAAGKIVDGAYSFQCKPGQKRVEITSYRLTGKKSPGGKPIGEMYVPERYSAKSELTADVTLDGSNNFDFTLKP